MIGSCFTSPKEWVLRLLRSKKTARVISWKEKLQTHYGPNEDSVWNDGNGNKIDVAKGIQLFQRGNEAESSHSLHYLAGVAHFEDGLMAIEVGSF